MVDNRNFPFNFGLYHFRMGTIGPRNLSDTCQVQPILVDTNYVAKDTCRLQRKLSIYLS